MGLSLLYPIGLAALAACLLPLLIHLARRQQSRLTEFAALRWLRAQPKPRQRIRIDEWPLLLLRLLLLALLALLMAGLAWRAHLEARPHVLVSPGLDPDAQRALALPEHARVQWLAEGFPAFDTAMPSTPQPVASLLREFDAQLPADAPLIVVVPSDWGQLDAQRPVLSRAVEWRVLPGHSPRPSPPARSPLRLVAVGFDPQAPAWRSLRALNTAWQATPAPLAIASAVAPDRDALPPGTVVAWGAGNPPPAAWLAWVREGGELLLPASAPAPAPADSQLQAVWRDEHGDVLLASAAFGRGRLWRLTHALDPAAFARLRDARFPGELASHLRPSPPPARARATEVAPLLQPRQWPRAPAALLPGLALLIALVFALERWLATSPRRGTP